MFPLLIRSRGEGEEAKDERERERGQSKAKGQKEEWISVIKIDRGGSNKRARDPFFCLQLGFYIKSLFLIEINDVDFNVFQSPSKMFFFFKYRKLLISMT